jgi:hypothetical protein
MLGIKAHFRASPELFRASPESESSTCFCVGMTTLIARHSELFKQRRAGAG